MPTEQTHSCTLVCSGTKTVPSADVKSPCQALPRVLGLPHTTLILPSQLSQPCLHAPWSSTMWGVPTRRILLLESSSAIPRAASFFSATHSTLRILCSAKSSAAREKQRQGWGSILPAVNSRTERFIPGAEARACCCSAARGWILPGWRDRWCHRSATPGGSGQRRRHPAADTAVGGSLGLLLCCWGCPLPHGRGSAAPSASLIPPRAVPYPG